MVGKFLGQQIRELMPDKYLIDLLKEFRRIAWPSAICPIKNILGNRNATTSPNLHFLNDHLNFFTDKLGAMIDMLHHTFVKRKIVIKVNRASQCCPPTTCPY
jgi:hypothetical protein